MSKTYNSDLQSNNERIQALINKANSLPEYSEGIELPELTNPATSTEILKDYEAIDGEGNKITGTIPTQAATTITPTDSEQIAVSAGTYCTGDIKVAASSGSGGAVETCTVTYLSEVPMSPDSTIIYYCDANFQLCEIVPSMMDEIEFNVLKNSIIYLRNCWTSGEYYASISGSATRIGDYSVYVTGDCYLTYKG